MLARGPPCRLPQAPGPTAAAVGCTCSGHFPRGCCPRQSAEGGQGPRAASPSPLRDPTHREPRPGGCCLSLYKQLPRICSSAPVKWGLQRGRDGGMDMKGQGRVPGALPFLHLRLQPFGDHPSGEGRAEPEGGGRRCPARCYLSVQGLNPPGPWEAWRTTSSILRSSVLSPAVWAAPCTFLGDAVSGEN